MSDVVNQPDVSAPESSRDDAGRAARLKRRRAIAACIGVAVAGAVGFLISRWEPAPALPPEPQPARPIANPPRGDFPLPPIEAGRFRNTLPGVQYVGSDACIDCHRKEYESYQKTGHSLALQDVHLEREPPDGEVHHALSGRSYRIYRREGQLRHREFVKLSDGKEVVLADFPMKYTMGSGHNARSYIVESDGFLMESPVTWYAAKNGWAMSPGYEKQANQQGFARQAQYQCVGCHAGRIEPIGESVHSMRVLEKSIGCERCHGPGSLHVARHKAGETFEGDFDDTIVNIRKLPAKRQEDVCSQCHMTNAADVPVRGRDASDFRPGQRMSDFVTGYRLVKNDKAMKVVGHTEQMQLSRCYTESKSMSCTTCHDPHDTPRESRKVDYYRSKCITCHEPEHCGLPIEKRKAADRQDNCVACHMPRSPTEIHHFEFTHHRVGIHKAIRKAKPVSATRWFVDLEPTSDVSRFSRFDRLRGRGLAYQAFAQSIDGEAKHAGRSAAYAERARKLLEDLKRRGLRDPVVDRALAHLYWRKDPDRCLQHAADVLKRKSIPLDVRRDALYLQATSYFDTKRYKQAMPLLERLTTIERFEVNWMLLSICRMNTGNLQGALQAALKAAEIAPDRAGIQERISIIYLRMKRPELARQHLQRAKLLKEIVQRK